MNKSDAFGLINSTIRSLKPYHLEPEECSVKLNQNENPFDWPATIKKEAARFCEERPWNRYPPFIPEALKDALAAYTGAPRGGVMVGNGSNEMLLVLMLSLVRPELPVVICQPTFTLYRLLADGLGAKPVTVPLDSALRYDVAGIKAAVKQNPGCVLVLCSPNNPTGAALDESELRAVLQVHSGFCVFDQAYVEFGGFDAMPLLGEFPNLVITRTFSKAFAGAGLRLGYLAGTPAVVQQMAKIKLPYNINFFSEHVAQVLTRNRGIIDERCAVIKAERDSMFAFLRQLPLDNVYPSAANFIMVRCRRKLEMFDFLKKKGILLRDVSSYPLLENCLRISIGSPEENGTFQRAVQSFFATP